MATTPRFYYTADPDHLLKNPERGMYSAETTPNTPGAFHTIVPEWLWLAPWCKKDLVWNPTNPDDTSQVLKDYGPGTPEAPGKLESARLNGHKILFRPRYDNEKDPGKASDDCKINGVPVFHADTVERQKNHIEAVAAMLGEYKDVIAFIQAGYLGNWGEWNHADYEKENVPLLYNRTDRSDILDHILLTYAAEGIAQDVELRMPVFAKEVVERWEQNPAKYNNASANVGLHNDCFMSSADPNGSDGGTYSHFTDFADDGSPQNLSVSLHLDTEEAAREWAKERTENSSFGGETCPRKPTGSERWRSCTNMTGATSEPASLHMNYLNQDFVKDAIKTWEEGDAQGIVCYDVIRRYLGYRFKVNRVEYPEVVWGSRTFSVAVEIENTGWARLHKPRDAYLVLRNVSPRPSPPPYKLLGGKVSDWAPGTKTTISFEVSATPPLRPWERPGTYPRPGIYSVRLWIPDPDLLEFLKTSPNPEEAGVLYKKAKTNYAVKLATLRNGTNVFDTGTGENDLDVKITVRQQPLAPLA